MFDQCIFLILNVHFREPDINQNTAGKNKEAQRKIERSMFEIQLTEKLTCKYGAKQDVTE